MTLTAQEAEVLRRLYGLGNVLPESARHIADSLGVSASEVKRVAEVALAKLPGSERAFVLNRRREVQTVRCLPDTLSAETVGKMVMSSPLGRATRRGRTGKRDVGMTTNDMRKGPDPWGDRR